MMNGLLNELWTRISILNFISMCFWNEPLAAVVWKSVTLVTQLCHNTQRTQKKWICKEKTSIRQELSHWIEWIGLSSKWFCWFYCVLKCSLDACGCVWADARTRIAQAIFVLLFVKNKLEKSKMKLNGMRTKINKTEWYASTFLDLFYLTMSSYGSIETCFPCSIKNSDKSYVFHIRVHWSLN